MENDQKLISAPYEVPQYPIEQIETKLIRWVIMIAFADYNEFCMYKVPTWYPDQPHLIGKMSSTLRLLPSMHIVGSSGISQAICSLGI